jgi:hypothetical protein
MIFIALIMLAAEIAALVLGVFTHVKIRSVVLATSLSCCAGDGDSKGKVDEKVEDGRLIRDLKLVSPTRKKVVS